MRISIVTPCFEAGDALLRTAASVIEAARRAGDAVHVEYFVIDGASSDGSAERVQRLLDKSAPTNLDTEVSSQTDRGMYDALANGLRKCSGDIHAYINAGDYYSPDAVSIVASLFASKNELEWITGLEVEYNDLGHLTSARLPFRFRRRLIRRGCYDGVRLPFLQQESTFWRAGVEKLVDLDKLRALRYAGDYYLWTCFAVQAELMVVEAWLGGFAFHKGQLSEARDVYRAELRSLSEPFRPLDWIRVGVDRILWSTPRSMKWRLGRGWLIVFNRESGEYRQIQ